MHISVCTGAPHRWIIAMLAAADGQARLGAYQEPEHLPVGTRWVSCRASWIVSPRAQDLESRSWIILGRAQTLAGRCPHPCARGELKPVCNERSDSSGCPPPPPSSSPSLSNCLDLSL